MGAHTITVTDDTFADEVLNSDKPVLVDFWAEWCGPCRMIAPVLDEIATAHKDAITVAKVNIDENPGVAQRYQILAIPTLVRKLPSPMKKIIGDLSNTQRVLVGMDLRSVGAGGSGRS